MKKLFVFLSLCLLTGCFSTNVTIEEAFENTLDADSFKVQGFNKFYISENENRYDFEFLYADGIYEIKILEDEKPFFVEGLFSDLLSMYRFNNNQWEKVVIDEERTVDMRQTYLEGWVIPHLASEMENFELNNGWYILELQNKDLMFLGQKISTVDDELIKVRLKKSGSYISDLELEVERDGRKVQKLVMNFSDYNKTTIILPKITEIELSDEDRKELFQAQVELLVQKIEKEITQKDEIIIVEGKLVDGKVVIEEEKLQGILVGVIKTTEDEVVKMALYDGKYCAVQKSDQSLQLIKKSLNECRIND